jgi:aspartate-semialdehyde dehydrogenase
VKVVVAGATGVVGREMLRTLEARRFPVDELIPLASPRSEGVRLSFAGDQVPVRQLDGFGWEGVDIALFSAGAAASKEHVPRAAGAGALVVDNSSAWRMDPEVPLVIPEINAEALQGHRGIVANPNCTAITALMAIAPLHREAGLTSLVMSSYQSVSGAGQKGIRELLEQVEKLRGHEDELVSPDPSALPAGEVFGRTIAYNVVPRAGSFEDGGSTSEETKLANETRKILDLPDLPVIGTVVRVPTIAGHAVSVHATFSRGIGAEEARDVLGRFPGVEVVDDPSRDLFPTPVDSAGRDEVLVGRIRQPAGQPNVIVLFAVGDNLRKGAALNAVQIAERLAGVS